VVAIPYPDPESVPGLSGIYERIAGLGRPVINLYRVMGHSPEGLEAYIGLSHFVRDNSELPPDLRELAILQTGLSLGCEYIARHHAEAARKAGVAEATIQRVLQGRRDGVGLLFAGGDVRGRADDLQLVNDIAVRRQVNRGRC
jgi:4-carboxymuconolactone decarboxylase